MCKGDGDERKENSTCGILKIINEGLLCFDLLTRPKMPFKVVHRKEVTHPGRWKSEEVAQALRRVYITVWEFEGNIRPTN